MSAPGPQPFASLFAAVSRGETFNAAGQQVPAEVIADLCTGRVAVSIHPRGVRIVEAEIIGLLDLEGAVCTVPLYLERCRISEGIRIQDAVMRTLVLEGSRLGPIDGRRATINGILNLNRSHLTTTVLLDAKINGSLVAEGARLRSKEEFGVLADRISVTGSVFLRNGFLCNSAITIVDSTVHGSIDFRRSVIHARSGPCIRSHHAEIGGGFYGMGLRTRGQIQMTSTRIGGTINLNSARLLNPGADTLVLNGAHIGAAILLRDGFHSFGEVSLRFATVGATVELDGATLRQKRKDGPNSPAPVCLAANSLSTKSHVSIGKSKCTGLIQLTGAIIGGELAFRDSTVRFGRAKGSGEIVLMADGTTIGGRALFRNTFFDGRVMLPQSKIGRSLGFEGGGISVHPKADFSLLANGATVGGELFFSEGFITDGVVRLRRISVNGQTTLFFCDIKRVELDGARCNSGFAAMVRAAVKEGLALAGSEIGGLVSLDDATIAGGFDCSRSTCKAGFLLSPKFVCNGEWSLKAARVTGSIVAKGVTIDNQAGEIAFQGDGLKVQGDANFRDAKITGTVRLRNADVTGDLDFGGATVTSTNGKAMRITGSSVGGSLFLRWKFCALGGVRLARTKVSGVLDFENAAILSNDPNILAIEAHGLDVQGALYFRKLDPSSKGEVSFDHASVGRLEDDALSWRYFAYRIKGFTFKACGAPTDRGKERIAWLRGQATWSVQPYEHTARVLRVAGYEEEAQRILISKSRHQRQKGLLSPYLRVKNLVLDLLLGYGYRSWRALLPIAGMVLLGSFVFDRAHYNNVLVAKDKPPAVFSRYAYSVDAFVPLINLKQRDSFVYIQPEDKASIVNVQAWRYQAYFWLHTALGWVLTTFAAAGLSGLVKKE
jgi:hypothetical protein